MFFYPGIKIAEILGIPCVRQLSQPAWNQKTVSNATWFFKMSCALIDLQVMGKKNAEYMALTKRTLIDAVLHDKPSFNIVYVPQVFQAGRESFGTDYMFTAPIGKSDPASQKIPYEEMKPPIVYISLGSIISNKGFCKECIRAFGGKVTVMTDKCRTILSILNCDCELFKNERNAKEIIDRFHDLLSQGEY